MDKQTGFQTILSSRAQREIIQSWKWYEERQAGLGDRFIEEVTRRMRLIETYPNRYPTRFKFYKESPVPVFPYLIIYRISNRKKLIHIVSVFHTSMNPAKKYRYKTN